MVSSCTIAPEVSEAFKEVSQNKAKYLLAQIDDGTSNISLVAKGEKDATFDTFKAEFPADLPRYAFYNLQFTTDDGLKMSKILFVSYVPDDCKQMGLKFEYANFKEAFKSPHQPINKEIQVNIPLDLDEQAWIEDL